MNRFYQVVYTVLGPLLRLLFPMRVVGLERVPEVVLVP